MSKNHYVDVEKKSVARTCLVSLIVFILLVVVLSNNIFSAISNNILSGILTLTGYLLAIASFITFIATASMLISIAYLVHEDKKAQEKSFIKIKEKLSNEFSKVTLKDFENSLLTPFLSNKDFICEAKLDSNNNIAVKIIMHSETITETNNYEHFLRIFDI